MNKNEILVIYGQDMKKMTQAVLEKADLKNMIPSKDTLIGIKPNLVGQILPSEGATTHPEIVEALILYLQHYDFHHIVVLESSWVGDKTSDALSCCGYTDMLAEVHVPFWDMQEDRGIDTDCAGMQLKICERVAQIGFMINVPVLKGHCQTRITCALKNMKGLIPSSEKRRFHRLGLHNPIAHLNTAIRQDFILTDSICSDLTFEDGGNPVRQDRIIAAADPVFMDTLGCRLIGIEPEDVPYLTGAAALGVGTLHPENETILVHDMEKDLPGTWRQDASAARSASSDGSSVLPGGNYTKVMRLADRVEEIESCSACYGSLLPVLQQLEREDLLKYIPHKICIGQGYRGKSGRLGVGNCTLQFDVHLPGCPPSPEEMLRFLHEYIANISA